VSGVVDTSFLIEELRQKFQRGSQYVEVDFRSLVNWVRIGDQLSHQIHPYPAKLLPHIAHFFTRASVLHHQHHKVLDPFCGSGTVALEASLAGHTPYVADANPLALLITKVKTTIYAPEELQQSLSYIASKAKRFRTAPEVSVVNANLWYPQGKKKALEILLRAILETTEGDHRNFFLVAFSVAARRLSWADPRISVPVKLKPKDAFTDKHNEKVKARLAWIDETDTVAEYVKICEANIERVQSCNLAHPSRVAAVQVGSDARCLKCPNSSEGVPLETGSIPLIVTSPPYGSAQKYIRATSLSLNWLGLAGPKGLSALEGRSIGREHLPAHLEDEIKEELPSAYEELLVRIKRKNELRARITRRYLHEMQKALSEMARVSATKGHVVIVIGNNMVCGEPLRSDEFVTEVLHEHGLTLDIGLIDHIKSRGLMTKRNKTASIISRECVLVFRK
jgi:hypothetical protein